MAEKVAEQCNWTGCEKTPRAKISGRAFCLEHFLQYSQSRVAKAQQMFAGRPEQRHLSPEMQTFLSEVISGTTTLATETRLLSPHQRDNLIRLSTTAAEIYRQIQRSPRVMKRVRCRVRTGILSTEIAERCDTLNVSQRGACLEIRQPLRIGQTVMLEKEGTNECARATVAWIKPITAERFAIGLEILNKEDFWGLGVPSKARQAGACEAKR